MKDYNFDENNFSLNLIVNENLLNTDLLNRFSDLKPKKEFHITLLGGKNRKLLEGLENKEAVKEKLFTIFNKYNFDFELQDYFLLEKEDLKSVIILVELKDLNNFFNELKKEFNLDFIIPTTHITLFVSDLLIDGQEFRGFSVDDWDDLKKTKIN